MGPEALTNNLHLIVDNSNSETFQHTDKINNQKDLQRWPLVGLSVSNFLQLLAMEQQTCLLEVYRDANHLGYFYFINGILYDAVCGDAKAEEAALKMMSWENTKLNLKQIANTSAVEQKINKSLMLLLMESSKRYDEAEAMPEFSENREVEHSPIDMPTTKLQERLDLLRLNMANALISASIICRSNDKLFVLHGNRPDEAESLHRLTNFILQSFDKGIMGGVLGDYFLIDLQDHQILVIYFEKEYEWNVLFDNIKCTLGSFQNIILPKIIKSIDGS